MIADFLKKLLAPEQDTLPPADARLALTALLVRIARSDGEYAAAEVAQIDQVIAARFELDGTTTESLRAEAEALEKAAPDTVRFTKAIKETVPYEDRLGVIEALWQVVLADGERDEAENALMRMVAPMLGVSDVESAMARKRIEAGA